MIYNFTESKYPQLFHKQAKPIYCPRPCTPICAIPLEFRTRHCRANNRAIFGLRTTVPMIPATFSANLDHSPVSYRRLGTEIERNITT